MWIVIVLLILTAPLALGGVLAYLRLRAEQPGRDAPAATAGPPSAEAAEAEAVPEEAPSPPQEARTDPPDARPAA